jgi:hypothetical protein
VFALVAALMVVLAALRPAVETPKAEAGLAFPGGIAALPSAAPAVPGLSNQSIPAIIGTGQPGIVSVFCFSQGLPLFYGRCPGFSIAVTPGQPPRIVSGGIISFELKRLYPTDSGPPGLTFDATGSDTLVVSDNGAADMDSQWGVVTVRVNAAAATLGGTQGVNEIVEVRATDETGDTRTVQAFVVDTILAFGPTAVLSTASQEQPLFVAYHCDVVGRAPVSTVLEQPIQGIVLPASADPDGDGSQGLDDMYDGYYSRVFDGIGPGFGYGSNSSSLDTNPYTGYPDLDLPDVWCGGNTASLFDDFVDFQTDLGLFSIEPVAQTLRGGAIQLATELWYFYPPVIDTGCGKGKSVDVFDVDALSSWAAWLLGGFPSATVGSTVGGGCDADGWRNGVVTMMLLGNGEVGTATVTAQQGGGVSPPRTANVVFIGEPALSLFLEVPATMGAEGGEFTVALLDSSLRPIADETVSCTLDPAGSGLIIVPQTGTMGSVTGDSPGQLTMKVVPTGAAVAAGGTLTLTCRLDRQPSVVGSAPVTLAATKSESVDLFAGCNPVVATWPDGTPIETVVKAVSPAETLNAVWTFDIESSAWQGYSAAAPEASDLKSVSNLQAIFVCMSASGTISRPVI